MIQLPNISDTVIDEEYSIRDRQIIVRREDLRPLPPLLNSGKMQMLASIFCSRGDKTIGVFGAQHSYWLSGVPFYSALTHKRGIICYPANKIESVPEWLKSSLNGSCELKLIRPNMTAVNTAQSKTYVESVGGYFIPFGLETKEVIETLTENLVFPDGAGTIVLAVGSGVTLIGLLSHSRRYNKSVGEVIAVSAGRPIRQIQKIVQKYLGGIPGNLVIVREHEYADEVYTECPFDTHPNYGEKAFEYLDKNIERLEEPIYFLNMGQRIGNI